MTFQYEWHGILQHSTGNAIRLVLCCRELEPCVDKRDAPNTENIRGVMLSSSGIDRIAELASRAGRRMPLNGKFKKFATSFVSARHPLA